MTAATLTIDLGALTANWRALDALSARDVETAAVVKADGYGLGAGRVSAALAGIGVKTFFVALADEGIAVRAAVGDLAEIFVFSGHMEGDARVLEQHRLTPLLNSPEQSARHFDQLANHPFGVQLDTGMSRLGMEVQAFLTLREGLMARAPSLMMSHLACADEPDHPQNTAQLRTFHELTDGLGIRRSLAATGGILLGEDYHFDLCRPGIGLYGGLPFGDARAVVGLDVPVIQTRRLKVGETVGYGAAWTAKRPSKIATLAAGYADGLIRKMGARAQIWAGDIPVPLIGRVSMDLLTVDVTDLAEVPSHLSLLGAHQSVDDLANAADTIGYEILTSLGARYKRVYTGG
ncbi:MAG: alanine racemase [Alphaproteobacteria bacterium]|nr:alanine racemase [Alphaproteobacteria bacterium]